MIITNHAIERGIERLGISDKHRLVELVKAAWIHGQRLFEIVDKTVKNKVNRIIKGTKTANNIRYYKHVIYVFCNDTLLTVISLSGRNWNRRLV